MITKSSVQMRLCQAVKCVNRSPEFQQKLLSAEYHYVSGDLYRANALLSEMGIAPVEEAPVSAHAKTLVQRPSTPLGGFIPVRAQCEEDHEPYQRHGGVCQRCKRAFYRGVDIQG
jgi:hypothetical protein